MRVIFLDRDGVINQYPGDADYVKSWDEFRFLANAKSALKDLKAAGFLIFVISNQAGVSKGIYSKECLDRITENMLKELELEGIRLDGVHYCIHRDEDHCSCRKPKTGLLDQVISELQGKGIPLEPKNSFFIGDAIRDMETGRKAGLKTILVFSGKEKPENKKSWSIQPDFTASSLYDAAQIILK